MISINTSRSYRQWEGTESRRNVRRASGVRHRSRPITLESLEVRSLLSIQGVPGLVTDAAYLALANRDLSTPENGMIAQVEAISTGQAEVLTDAAEMAAVGTVGIQLNPDAQLGPYEIPTVQPSVRLGPDGPGSQHARRRRGRPGIQLTRPAEPMYRRMQPWWPPQVFGGLQLNPGAELRPYEIPTVQPSISYWAAGRQLGISRRTSTCDPAGTSLQ